MKEIEKFEEVKKDEVNKEVNNLILEVVLRLERESPQLLQLLLSPSEVETPVSKLSKKKSPSEKGNSRIRRS